MLDTIKEYARSRALRAVGEDDFCMETISHFIRVLVFYAVGKGLSVFAYLEGFGAFTSDMIMLITIAVNCVVLTHMFATWLVRFIYSRRGGLYAFVRENSNITESDLHINMKYRPEIIELMKKYDK